MLYRPRPQHRKNVRGVLMPLTAAVFAVFGSRSQDAGRPIGAFYPHHVSSATWEHLGGIWYRALDERKVQDRVINPVTVAAFVHGIYTGQDVVLPSGTVVTWEPIPAEDAARLPPPLKTT